MRASPHRLTILAFLLSTLSLCATGRGDDSSAKKPLPTSPMSPGVQTADPPQDPGGREPPPEEVKATKLTLAQGRVEGSLAYFKVQIDFVTGPRTGVLPLSFTQGQLKDLLLDGRTPRFRFDGAPAILVSSAGEHHLVFDVVVHLAESTQRGGCLVLKLDLPRAADTQLLDFTLPEGFKDLRVNDHLLTEREILGVWTLQDGRRLKGLLTQPADRLFLSWRGARASTGPLQTAAEGPVEVSVDERHTVRTKATLNLKVLANQTDLWRLVVPAGAQVKIASQADENRVKDISYFDIPFFRIVTLTLKDRGADPLSVIVTHDTVGLRPGGPAAAVGPFLVVGAARQSGTILVTNSAADWRIRCQPSSMTSPRVLAPDETRQAGAQGFTWYAMPQAIRPDDPAPLSLLSLQAEAIHGQLEVRPVYQLRLPRESGERRWQLLTTLEVRQVQPGASRLEIVLPADGRYIPMTTEEDRPPAQVLRIEAPGPGATPGLLLAAGNGAALVRPVLVLHLARERWEPFKLVFRVQYGPTPAAGTASFSLPRYREASEIVASSATVVVPDDVELSVPGGVNGNWELVRQTPQELTWKPDAIAGSSPERLIASWRTAYQEVRVGSDVNLDLVPGRGRISQELKLKFPRGLPPLLCLRLPRGLQGLSVTGGTWRPITALMPLGIPFIAVKPADGSAKGTDWTLTFTYDIPVVDGKNAGDDSSGFVVPLFTIERPSVSETRVRIWSEPGALPRVDTSASPALFGGGWSELPIERLPADARRPGSNPGRLPVLVLRSDRPEPVLTLAVGGSGTSRDRPVTVLADRALLRIDVEGEGQQARQQVRARFRLQKLFTNRLDIEFPAPVAGLDLRVTLDGLEITPETVDEAGQRSDSGRVARLRINPDLIRRNTGGSLLELKYQTRANVGSYRTTLQAPILRGEQGQLVICWQVSLPAGWVAIGPEGGPATLRSWSWRGWLLAPRPAARADDLERWIAGPDATAASGAEVGSLLCWREGFDPLTVTHAPQQTWLLVCSLGILLAALSICLLLARAMRSRPGARDYGGRLAWLMLLILLLSGFGAALTWPGVSATIAFGAEPGAVVLVLLLFFAALWYEQRRRRRTYLPSFRRGQQSSSVLRPVPPSSGRGPGEPSTVDGPRPASGQFPALGDPRPHSEASR